MEEWEGHDGEDDERTCPGGEAEADDQSFRQSFYTSGTDWSRLYEVDDYGVPLSSAFEEEDGKKCGDLEFKSSGLASEGSGGSEGSGRMFARNSAARLQNNCNPIELGYYESNVDPQCAPSSSNRPRASTAVKAAGNKAVVKFVQSDLSNFLGIKRKVGLEKSSTGKKFRQQDVGVLLGISPPLKTSAPDAAEFLTKFNRGGNKPADKSETWRNKKGKGNFGAGADGGGEAEAPRKCPFYKKIPGTVSFLPSSVTLLFYSSPWSGFSI